MLRGLRVKLIWNLMVQVANFGALQRLSELLVWKILMNSRVKSKATHQASDVFESPSFNRRKVQAANY